MAAQYRMEESENVANKVMRRVQVSKMTRALQDRLALANVKAQNGWENMSLDVIEPHVEEQLRRKRPTSSNDTASDVASTTSSRFQSSASSPLTTSLFSDETFQSGGRTKRLRSMQLQSMPVSAPRSAGRARISSQPWKKSYNLPESSPIKQVKHARFNSNNLTHTSFVSEVSTVTDDLPSPEASEDDDADLPVHSFSINTSTRIASSPPRTPPPARQMRKAQSVSWSRTPKTGDDGADLLIYLATSPSANHGAHTKTPVQAPSTPPCKSTPLPSSHMTPGMGWGPTTPGTGFNFADFVNVTPSPAQGAFSRTPVVGRTPGASARRKLNFENLMPPSPSMIRHSKDALGMELGGELVS